MLFTADVKFDNRIVIVEKHNIMKSIIFNISYAFAIKYKGFDFPHKK